MLFKNAAQKIHVYAYDSTTGAAKTGDAANITGYVSLDGTPNAIDDTNPAEVDSTNMPGIYAFDLTAAETNCNSFALYAKSATASIRIEPIIGFTNAGAVPNAIAGANGGLPTTNGTKQIQTVDLTASQSIACSDKTGFSLSATGADLILKTSTFAVALAAAINELATYGLTALNTLLVTTGIKAATIPAATLAANQDVRNVSGTLPNVTLAATQASYAPAKVADLGVVQTADNNTKLTAIQDDYARRTGDYSTYAGGDTSGVTTLLTRLSAVRAGYLDLLNTYLDSAASAIKTVVDAIKVVTDKFRFTVANQIDANALSGGGGLDATGVRAAVGLATANLDTQLTALPTDADVNAACDTAISDAGIPGALATAHGAGSWLTGGGGAAPTVEEIRTEMDDNSTKLGAMKTKIDKLTFTDGTNVDSNNKSINSIPLTGNGTASSPWRPL